MSRLPHNDFHMSHLLSIVEKRLINGGLVTTKHQEHEMQFHDLVSSTDFYLNQKLETKGQKHWNTVQNGFPPSTSSTNRTQKSGSVFLLPLWCSYFHVKFQKCPWSTFSEKLGTCIAALAGPSLWALNSLEVNLVMYLHGKIRWVNMRRI